MSVRSTRRIINVKYTRPFLFRYAGLWLLLSLALVVFSSVLGCLLFEQHWETLLATNPQLGPQYEASRQRFLIILVVEAALLIAALIGLAVMTTHRLAGPLIGMRMICDEIAAGDFSRRLGFRRANPELDELQASFNKMMDVVEQRVGKK